jgi:hypothetical protein
MNPTIEKYIVRFFISSYYACFELVGLKTLIIRPITIETPGRSAPVMAAERNPISKSIFSLKVMYLKNVLNGIVYASVDLKFLACYFCIYFW